MDIESLRSFLAVVSTGSFTKAAREMYVTQPTLSRRVHDLEVELDAKLLVREARSVRLTPEGLALRQAAADILSNFDALPLKVKQASATISCSNSLVGTLNIGYQKNTNQTCITRFMKLFQRRYPRVDIYARCEPSNSLEHLLDSGIVDIMFMLKPNIDLSKSADDVVLNKTSLKLLVPITHPFADRESVSIGELKDQEFIMCERRLYPEFSDFIVSRCINSGFYVKATRYVSSLQDEATLVSIGKGIAFTSPMISYGDPLPSLDLCAISINDVDLSLNYIARIRQDMPPALREAALQSITSFNTSTHQSA